MSFDWRDVYPGSVVVTLVLTRAEAAELLDQAKAEGRVIARNVVKGLPFLALTAGGTEPQAPAAVSAGARLTGAAASSAAGAARTEAVEEEAGGRFVNGAGSIEPVAALRPAQEAVGNEAGSTPAPAVLEAPSASSPPAESNIVILPVIHRTRMAEPPQPPLPSLRPAPARAEGAARRPGKPAASRSGGGFLGLQPEPDPFARPDEPKRRFVNGRGWVKRGEITAADMELVRQAVAEGRVTKCPPRKCALSVEDETAASDWSKKAKARKGGRKQNPSGKPVLVPDIPTTQGETA